MDIKVAKTMGVRFFINQSSNLTIEQESPDSGDDLRIEVSHSELLVLKYNIDQLLEEMSGVAFEDMEANK